MSDRKYFSELVTIFQGVALPEPGFLAGYSALISVLNLKTPRPYCLAMISTKAKNVTKEGWRIYSPSYRPADTLGDHLIFALKYEGLDLYLLKQVFLAAGKPEITSLVEQMPNSKYVRRIWLLYEWLLGDQLEIPDLTQGNYVEMVDQTLQYGRSSAPKSARHRIINNLPGVPEFCPLIRRTEKLDQYMNLSFSNKLKKTLTQVHPFISGKLESHFQFQEAIASYAIEGERPSGQQAVLWKLAIGKSGQIPICEQELTRLAQIVLGNGKVITGYRRQQGFIGEHEYISGRPIPDHISARWEDLESLMSGLIQTAEMLEKDIGYDPVLATAVLAFGFVFIHPFVDGNGRLHRYLIQHMLHRKGFVLKGQVVPVSEVILSRISGYRQVLESFSLPRLPLIEWEPAADNNVQIFGESGDLYRYFDATQQAEFLYSCIQQAVDVIIPAQIDFLHKYDRMKSFLDDFVPMPDRMVSLLVSFLEQGNGTLSKRAKNAEFKHLTESEIFEIETRYREIFGVSTLSDTVY